MRTLAIGDIHGSLRALDALLAVVAPTAEDRLITLGDYVDRGFETRQVLDRLIELYDAGRLIALRGNHDEMMLTSRDDHYERRMWLRFGGIETLESYGHWPDDEVYDKVPDRHWRFLKDDLKNFHETEGHLFVHASAYPDLPLDKQESYVLLWQRLFEPVKHQSGKVLICGHTRQDSGYPLNLKTTICIDTGIYEEHGWLTCLHVESGEFWQANQRGETRSGSLGELPPREE